MFIPVTKAVGPAHIDIVADISGIFTAACPFVYEGQGYSANAEIQVERTKTIRLTADIQSYRAISVKLQNKQYYWYTDVPKTLRYVDDDAYKRITGTVPGRLLNAKTGASVPYVTTQTFSGGDTVASIDFTKKKIWFFNTKSEVKSITVGQNPVAVLFVPRWSTVEGIVTTCYVVTESSILKLTENFDIAETFSVDTGVVAASGDVKGMIVLGYANRLVLWRDGSIESTVIQPELNGIHSIFVAPDNTYVVGCNSGIMFVWNTDGEWFSDVVTSYSGRYWAFDISAQYLYAVDAFNRCLIKVELAERTYSAVYYDRVPRDVVLSPNDNVYVSFLDHNVVFKYDAELTSHVEVPALKSFGAAYLDAYYITDLYSDASSVTKLEATVEQQTIQISNLPLNEESVYRWTVDWVRPEFVRVGATNAVVRVNGDVFTSGYLRSGDSVAVYVPASSNYYDDRYVALIGRRDTVFEFRTIPKLFPDYVVVDSVLSAFLRVTYEEAFEVTGMTWGFDVGVTLNSTDVQFAVNDGPFGLSGRIRNGDIVQLSGSVKTLIAKRTAHTIKTEYGEPVAEWTLLPMLLDGTTKRTESTVKKDKFAHLFEVNSSHASPAQIPSVYPSLTMLYTETYAAQSSQASIGTVNINGECTPSLPCYSVKDTKFVVQPSLLSVSAKGRFDVQSKDSVYDFKNTASLGSQGTMYSLDTELKQDGRMTVKIVEFQTGVELHLNSNVSSFVANSVLSVAYSSSSISSIYGRTASNSQYAEMTYSNRTLDSTLVAPFVYQDHFNYSTTTTGTLFDRRRLASTNQQRAQHLRFAAFHKEKFTSKVDAFYTYPISEFVAAADRRVQKNRHTVETKSERRITATRWEFGSEPINRRLGIFTEISTSYVLRPSLDKYSIYATYARRPNPSRLKIQTEIIRRTSNARTVVAPQRAFVHSARKSYALADEASGFGTREQAQAYAESINAYNAVYLEIDGKWIFVTRPIADNAACAIITRPVSAQKRYGYSGGG